MSNPVQPRQPDRASDRPVKRLVRPGNSTRESRFEVDMSTIPAGMSVEWKRVSLMGFDDKRNKIVCDQYHWKPVPHSMQPNILGHLGKDNPEQPIIVDGLQLMMRPAYLNEEAESERNKETDYQTQQQLASLRLSSKQQVGEQFTKIKKSYERVQQPVE